MIAEPWVVRTLDFSSQWFISKEGKIEIKSRGDIPPGTSRLMKAFRFARTTWTRTKVKDGIMLSGEKLIDNKDYRDSINDL